MTFIEKGMPPALGEGEGAWSSNGLVNFRTGGTPADNSFFFQRVQVPKNLGMLGFWVTVSIIMQVLGKYMSMRSLDP